MPSLYPFFKFVGHALLPPKLRDHIDIYSSLRKVVERPVEISSPEKARVLILSPHPDDEAIGCGGTMLRHLDAGAEVSVCYIMDGRTGGQEEGTTEDEIAKIRKEEALALGRMIGLSSQVFLELRDRSDHETSIGVNGLKEVLRDMKPEIVYTSSMLDQHPEHSFTSRLLVDSVDVIPSSTTVRQYEVWTPIVPSHVVEISAVMERKKSAIAVYKSQLIREDLGKVATCMANYRGFIHLFRDCFAEPFLCCTHKEFTRLAHHIDIWKK